MAEFRTVCKVGDVPEGEGRTVAVGDRLVAVFHSGCAFHAIDDVCTHDGGPLAQGELVGCEIECPLHASKFNLRTGEVDAPPAKRSIRTHTVHIEDDSICVELSDEQPNLPPGVTFGAKS